jgi:hypothetical protein
MRLRRRSHAADVRLSLAAAAVAFYACGGRLAGQRDDGGPAAAIVTLDAQAGVGERDAAPAADARATDATLDASGPSPTDAAIDDVVIDRGTDDDPDGTAHADAGDGGWIDACGHRRPDAFADEVISFDPGPNAGFGQSDFPCVVLGPPDGAGATAGSLDVLSLGDGGAIVVRFDDVELVDGPGPDLLVFENALPGFVEPGFVAVSEDGADWHEWPCRPQDADGGYPGCAGIHPVLSNPGDGISPTNPAVAGGDAFDLADLGVARARYVRIRDSGFGRYSGTTGGFDLDAVAASHAQPREQ